MNKARPVYRWTPRRIRARLDIAYMASACARQFGEQLLAAYTAIKIVPAAA